MPVQINEMIIRANIKEPAPESSPAKTSAASDINKEELIRECAALVMEMIQDKKER